MFSVNTLSITCTANGTNNKVESSFLHGMFPIQKLSNRTVYLELNIKVNKITFEIELCSQVSQEIPSEKCFAVQQMTANEYKTNIECPTFVLEEEKLRELWSRRRRISEVLGCLFSSFSMNKFEGDCMAKLDLFLVCPHSRFLATCPQKCQNKNISTSNMLTSIFNWTYVYPTVSTHFQLASQFPGQWVQLCVMLPFQSNRKLDCYSILDEK